jgi:hypothetical protein
MAKQIIRLTEADLHRIIKESVDRILRESEEPTPEQLEAMFKDAAARVKKYKGKRQYQKEFLEAAKEMQDLKLKLGKCKTVVNPDSGYSDRENEKRGIQKKVGLRRVMGDKDMIKRREEDMRDKEGLKGVAVNDIDDILGV